MKTTILTLILILGFGAFAETKAQKNAQSDSPKVAVKVGKQKKESRSRITVKFLSLVEDSRCPEGVNCIQAGSAKIKVSFSIQGSEPVTLEMGTNPRERGGVYESYAIYLDSVTPAPKNNVRINRNAYTATFTIVRLSR